MWCASSVSMKRVERESGSNALSASERSWYLPSRSVKNVNMKNESQSAQRVSVLARHLLPDGFSEIVAARDRAIFDLVGEEDAPAVVGHLHVREVRPTFVVDADRRAEEDLVFLEAERAHFLPPADEA